MTSLVIKNFINHKRNNCKTYHYHSFIADHINHMVKGAHEVKKPPWQQLSSSACNSCELTRRHTIFQSGRGAASALRTRPSELQAKE